MKTIKDLTVQEKLRLICGKGRWYTEDFGGETPAYHGIGRTRGSAHGA